jgi:hypothetical protein
MIEREGESKRSDHLPRSRSEARDMTRNLSILTQTLQTLRHMRAGATSSVRLRVNERSLKRPLATAPIGAR